MSYTSKLNAIHEGLGPIFPDQDRIQFGPQLREDIRIIDENGVFFNFNKTYTADDEYFPEFAGSTWVIGDIAGWFSLPEPYMPNIERGFGDGSFDFDGRLLAREITLTGTVIFDATNRSDYIGRRGDPKSGIDTMNYLARRKINSMFNLVRRGTWLVLDEDGLLPVGYEPFPHEDETAVYANRKRASFVRLAGNPEIETINSRGRILFQIPLRAADPIKYEWVDTLSETPDFEFISGNGYNLGYIEGVSPTSEFRSYSLGTTDWEISSSSSGDVYSREYSEVQFSNDTSTDYLTGYRSYSGDVAVSSEDFGSNIICINHGNVNVSCLFRITGPVYGPADIKNETTGQTIRILASDSLGVAVVGQNEYLDIDTYTRDVRKGDSVFGQSPYSSRGLLEPLVDWIELIPGENIISFTDLGASGVIPVLQVYWRSGWIG